MASIEKVAADVRASIAQATAGIAKLVVARQEVDDALTEFTNAWHGTGNADLGRVAGELTDLLARIDAAISTVNAGIAASNAYLHRIEGTAEPTAQPQQSTGPADEQDDAGADQPPEMPQEKVDALREELPEPVQPGQRQKTHGRWVGDDVGAEPQVIVSGEDKMAQEAREYLAEQGVQKMPAAVSHVETKLAVNMVRTGVEHATVVINHVTCRGPFGCDTLLPAILDDGSTLTVHGTTADGQPTYTRYTGRARR